MVVLVAFFGLAATVNNSGKYFEISKNIEIFTNLYKEINTYYVDEVDPAKLMRTGVDAMLESLDPYTNYISESEIEGFRYITEGKSKGIGASIRKFGDDIVVTHPYANSPAQKAGLKAGDIILAVDGKSALGKNRSAVDNILQGFPGTQVELKIKRPGVEKEMMISLTREEVNMPNVPYSGLIRNDIAYVSLSTFTRNAGRNVADALKKIKEEKPDLKGVIFDLRDNGGGLLTEAVNVSNVFIPKGELVVSLKGKVKEWDRSYKTLNNPVDAEVPLVVLIDEGSASASEIVSGVLQDLDRGVLLGQRSYGKGLVQNTHDVGYNSKVKMTTAKYYIPSGRCIQGVKYENGEPVDIPDSERTPFKTRNERKVLDGGGVKPDVYVKDASSAQIIKSLRGQHMIFHFATDYTIKHETIASPEDFQFTDYDGFIGFLKKRGFDYETEGEELLDQLRVLAKDENFIGDIDSNIKTIEGQIDEIKKQDLEKYKKEIIDLIEKEIVSRYYYQKGRIQIGLRNDLEIEKAVELLYNQAEYKKLLE
jgi:carboxyl-terminal processing protease